MCIRDRKKHPELNLILLDGRTNTIYTISDKLHELPPNTALLMGTWRVDMYDGYFMRNATYTMMEAAGDVPTFSISSVGIGYWAIGGVTPSYRPLGKDMAYQAVRLLQGCLLYTSYLMITLLIYIHFRLFKELTFQ